MSELILYCKDVPVYSITEQKVYNSALLPGIMQFCADDKMFNMWKRARYSCNSNAYSRGYQGVQFGQGKRSRVDLVTHSFSLSDCYWIKSNDETVTFDELTPYKNAFWFDKDKPYNGEAVPTLYTNGFLSKKWLSKDVLMKLSNDAEYECIRILNCFLPCRFPCERLEGYDATTKQLRVRNFTDLGVFFESADMTGMLDPDNFTLQDEIKMVGIATAVVDAVFGNGDRHAGNFGMLRSTDTGAYLRPAPLFDFDHALDVKSVGNDILMQDGITAGAINPDLTKYLCMGIDKFTTFPIFKARADYLLAHCN